MAKLKLIKPTKPNKHLSIPDKYKIDNLFVKKEVQWQKVKLSLKDKMQLAWIWLKAKQTAFKNWKYEHVFLTGAFAALSFVIFYFAWMLFMYWTVQTTFHDAPSEDYGKCFNIWDVYGN